MRRLFAVILFFLCHVSPLLSVEPVYSFGIVADVQYADRPNRDTRRYSEAIDKLEKAIEYFNKEEEIKFLVNLGDTSNGDNREDIDKVLAEFKNLKVKTYHVLGNHDLRQHSPKELVNKLDMKHDYYSFTVEPIRFIVLNTLEISRHSIDPQKKKFASEYYENNKEKMGLRIYDGMLSKKQYDWLDKQITHAKKKGLFVLILTHVPADPSASGLGTNLWDYQQMLSFLEGRDNVVAYLAGHYHEGGLDVQNGITHLTVPAVCNAPENGNSFGVFDVYPENIIFRGFGSAEKYSTIIPLSQRTISDANQVLTR